MLISTQLTPKGAPSILRDAGFARSSGCGSLLLRSLPKIFSGLPMDLIFKIVPEKLWHEAEAKGTFKGSAVDLADGFIHFSTAAQLRETAAKHFAGQDDLLIVAIDEEKLGEALRYEVSRGGALFPHLYAPLPFTAVAWVKPLPLGADGHHIFPDFIP